MTMRIAALVVALAFSCACRTTKYKGKNVCELLKASDIEAIYGEPFNPGQYTGLDDNDEEYIGSDCAFESVARAPNRPKAAKFRVFAEVTYIDPNEASITTKRQDWEKSMYNGKHFYTNIHDVAGIADGAIGATDYNHAFAIWSIIKPSTKMEVEVMNVVESEAEDRARAIALKLQSLLEAERKTLPQ